MYKILILNNISPKFFNLLPDDFYCSKDIKNPDAIVVRSFDLHKFKFNENLKAIFRAGSGINNIPVEECTKKNIAVFNTPGANANAVSELTIASLFLISRNIINAANWVKSQSTNKELNKTIEAKKSLFLGNEIKDKTLGIVGFGNIGKLVASAALKLQMKIIWYDPFVSNSLKNFGTKVNSIGEIYEHSDFISLHLPATKTSFEMINKDSISKMKQSVKILNFARGELVKPEDIIKAIKARKIEKYITDFPTIDMLDVDNIIALPHIGASTIDSQELCAKMVAVELVDFFKHKKLVNCVNF